jgi:hypothetical protein
MSGAIARPLDWLCVNPPYTAACILLYAHWRMRLLARFGNGYVPASLCERPQRTDGQRLNRDAMCAGLGPRMADWPGQAAPPR